MVHKRKFKKLSSKMEENIFELTDIFEDMNEKNVKKNIEYILRREKLWSPKFQIIFPAGGLQEINKKENFYQFDFEVFSTGKGISRMPLVGTVYGTTQLGEIIDMTMEVEKTGEEVK